MAKHKTQNTKHKTGTNASTGVVKDGTFFPAKPHQRKKDAAEIDFRQALLTIQANSDACARFAIGAEEMAEIAEGFIKGKESEKAKSEAKKALDAAANSIKILEVVIEKVEKANEIIKSEKGAAIKAVEKEQYGATSNLKKAKVANREALEVIQTALSKTEENLEIASKAYDATKIAAGAAAVEAKESRVSSIVKAGKRNSLIRDSINSNSQGISR